MLKCVQYPFTNDPDKQLSRSIKVDSELACGDAVQFDSAIGLNTANKF